MARKKKITTTQPYEGDMKLYYNFSFDLFKAMNKTLQPRAQRLFMACKFKMRPENINATGEKVSRSDEGYKQEYFTYTFSEAENMLGYKTNKVLREDFAELIRGGFVDCITRGTVRGNKKFPNVYQYSTRWIEGKQTGKNTPNEFKTQFMLNDEMRCEIEKAKEKKSVEVKSKTAGEAVREILWSNGK